MYKFFALVGFLVGTLALADPGDRHEVEFVEIGTLPWGEHAAVERLDHSLRDISKVLRSFRPRDLDYTNLSVEPEPGNRALLRFEAHLFGKTLPFRGHSEVRNGVGDCAPGRDFQVQAARVVMDLTDSHAWIAENFSQVEADLCIQAIDPHASRIRVQAALIEGRDRGTLTYGRVKELLSRQVRPLLDALLKDMGAGVHGR